MKKNIQPLGLASALVALPLIAGNLPSIGGAPTVWLSSELIGMKVVSEEGESLGKIEDIVVHPGGQASYAVLSFGGWLGMGDKLFAMPWTVLETVEVDAKKEDSERSLVLPLDKEHLKRAPGFDKKNWPVMANPDWAKDIDAFYMSGDAPKSVRPGDSAKAAASKAVINWKSTDLKGTNVQTADGTKLGDIAELAIDTNGRVSYVVLSVGGFLGIGDRFVAVPWGSLKFSMVGEKLDEKQIVLAATKKQLEEAPEFKRGEEHRAEMSASPWIVQVHKYFECAPYWDEKSETDKPDSKKESK